MFNLANQSISVCSTKSTVSLMLRRRAVQQTGLVVFPFCCRRTLFICCLTSTTENMLLYLLLLFFHFIALVSMNSIKPDRPEQVVAERTNINLTCEYDGDINSIQWYQQHQTSRPEFLLYITEDGSIHPTRSDFSAHIDKTQKRVALEIISSKLKDSALYYCALEPTVTGNTKTLYKNLWSKDNRINSTTSTIQVEIMLLLFIWMMIVSFQTGFSEDLLTLSEDVLTVLEGETVNFSCNYSVSVNNLFWYQQKSSSSPKLLISKYSEKKERLSFEHEKQTKKFHLEISSAAVKDSALYYCALSSSGVSVHEFIIKSTDQRSTGKKN
ncbi:uncharacterized protein [Brachyistius frenatus]|uniref:uncharacterized protein n=1 Tax=Brachyistius frenatus TaxID=100188 RepID=UPI0037E82DBD